MFDTIYVFLDFSYKEQGILLIPEDSILRERASRSRIFLLRSEGIIKKEDGYKLSSIFPLVYLSVGTTLV